MMKTGVGVAILAALPGAALAEPDLRTLRYLCERGVEVPVAYVNGAAGSVAVLHVEGRQIALIGESAASGARFGWPSGGSSYVWWTKGDTATLLWKDGAAGTETAVLSGCAAQD